MSWPGDSEGTVQSSSQAATCPPHTAEASHCPLNCWTPSREAVNTNFSSLWFDPTRNQTRAYRFGSRRFIHSTTSLSFSNSIWTRSEITLTYYVQGVEPNLNPNCKPEWTISFRWTRTEPEPAKFYFSKPEPNLNPQNCALVNPNRTWTPNKSKNIFFNMRMSLALVHAQ